MDDLNDIKCPACGRPTEATSVYCSMECFEAGVNWGLWHPVVRGIILHDKSYFTKEDALRHNPQATHAVTHGEWFQCSNG